MLRKGERIERALFADILKSRNFVNSPHFTLRVSTGLSGGAKLAVSVSKKVAKSAVARNTTRRRAYAVLESRVKALSPGLYLFVAKKGAETLRGEKLFLEIESLLKGFERR